jgi:hypothetical protein
MAIARVVELVTMSFSTCEASMEQERRHERGVDFQHVYRGIIAGLSITLETFFGFCHLLSRLP